jgi:hypothetical protein
MQNLINNASNRDEKLKYQKLKADKKIAQKHYMEQKKKSQM